MKKVLLAISILLVSESYAQQDPLFSGEGFNVFQHNPASYGNMEIFSFNSAIRIQWDGVSNAPRTLNLNTGGRICFGPNQSAENKFELRMGTNYQYQVVGFQRNHDWKLAIGYPIKLKNATLVVSVAPGLLAAKFSPSWVPPQTPIDSLLPQSKPEKTFDMNAGLLYNWKTLYVGISATHLLAPSLSTLNYSVARHYYLDFGYKIPVGKHHLFPMLQVKSDGAGAVFQAFTYFVFKDDLFSVGAGYRLSDAVNFGAAFQKWGVRVAYHYDYTLNPLKTYSKGSHEIRLGYIVPLKS